MKLYIPISLSSERNFLICFLHTEPNHVSFKLQNFTYTIIILYTLMLFAVKFATFIAL